MDAKNLAKIFEKKSLLDILQHIQVKNGIAASTDLELSCSVQVDLPDGIYDGGAWKTNRYILAPFPINDFPEMPGRDDKTEFVGTFHTDKLTDIIKIVSPEIKFNLGGALYIVDHDDAYCCVATDGHRLYCVGEPLDPKKFPNFIISRKAMEFLQQYPAWQCWKNENNLFFETDNVKFSCRVIDQKFPNYQSVIPNKKDCTEFGNEELLDCISGFHAELKRMGIKSRNNGLWINVSDGKFIMSKEQDGNIYYCNGPVAAVPVSFAINADFIKDAASVPGKKSVYTQTEKNETVDSPICIRTQDGHYVVMPLEFDRIIDRGQRKIEIKLPQKNKKSLPKKTKPVDPQENGNAMTQQLLQQVKELEQENIRLKAMLEKSAEIKVEVQDVSAQYAANFSHGERESVFKHHHGAPASMVPWLKQSGYSWNMRRRVWVKPC